MNVNPLKTIKMKKNNWITLFFIGGLLLSSCSNDDENPAPVNEEEVITTITVTLTPEGDGEVITLESRDLDGDGPNAPVVNVSGSLAGNTTYSGSIELLNETVSPAEDITVEVAEEAEEHQFLFGFTGPVSEIAYLDEDSNGNPIGIEFSLTTLTAGPGTLSVTLRHEPKKPNDGTLTDAGGETDVAITFNFLVE